MQNINDLPSQENLTREELIALGIVPTIHTPRQVIEKTFSELKVDGRIYAGNSIVTWDSYDFDIKIRVPMILSELKVKDIFQTVLDDVVKTMREMKDGNKKIWLP